VFCPTAYPNVAESAFLNTSEFIGEDTSEDESFSALTDLWRDMTIGRTYYRFTRPKTVNYAVSGNGWACYMSGLTGYSGNADTPEQAFEELKIQIHTAFQTLLRKRPFEMDEDEHAKWVELVGVIDLLHYKTTTPVTTYEVGQVSFAKVAYPHHINWINGKRDPIDPHKVPGELMSCRPGQWVDAVVRRDPVTQEVLEIESLRRISFHIPSQSELKSAWEAMPEAKLEPGDWVW
jgi:hypothetical protein